MTDFNVTDSKRAPTGHGELQAPDLRSWGDYTWSEIDALDRARLVAILPVGATEAHGPHLPLSTDVVIAEAMARSACDELRRRGRPAIVLPPMLYSAAPFARGFAGTISLSPETAAAIIHDIGAALAHQGLRSLAIANAHLDPTHLASIYAAKEQLASSTPELDVIFADVTRRRWVARLSDEFKSGACHAGRYEGSIVMASRPDLVREAIQSELPANPVSLVTAMREGHDTFEAAGGEQAYFGAPAEATAAEGEATIGTLGAILVEAVEEVLGTS